MTWWCADEVQRLPATPQAATGSSSRRHHHHNAAYTPALLGYLIHQVRCRPGHGALDPGGRHLDICKETESDFSNVQAVPVSLPSKHLLALYSLL